MGYFDIQEAILKKWNDQPSRNQWLVHGCYWELVVASLVGIGCQATPRQRPMSQLCCTIT